MLSQKLVSNYEKFELIEKLLKKLFRHPGTYQNLNQIKNGPTRDWLSSVITVQDTERDLNLLLKTLM